MNTAALAKLIERPVETRPLPLSLAYPRGAVFWEAAKGALGAGGCFGVLAFLSPAPAFGWVLGVVGAFFLVYLVRQVLRLTLRVRLDDGGVVEHRAGLQRAVRWGGMEGLRLGFYPFGRGAASGTLVLTLSAGGTRIKHDSTLDHFPTLLARAAAAGREKSLTLDETTRANLEQLGL